MSVVHVVLPNDIDDPSAPSGGNGYDRQVCRGLAAAGWSVREHAVAGSWPEPAATERADLAGRLAALPDGAIVLLDGLVGSAVPEAVVPEAGRLRLVLLVHLPLGDESAELRLRERAVLAVASAVVAVSAWTRQRLLAVYGLPADRVHVAIPGVAPAPLVAGSAAGSELLCVAAVTPRKGHDVLLEALAAIGDRPFTCVCVGSLELDPDFVAKLQRQATAAGLADRVHFVGPQAGAELDARYAAADLLVLASRGETYGMVVVEALARGIPVVATDGRGLPEALGQAPDGSRPGVLVPVEDPAALAGALTDWLTRAEVRRRLRRSARDRRATLTGWAETARAVSIALNGVRSA